MINFKEFCLLESTLIGVDVIELGKGIRDTYKANAMVGFHILLYTNWDIDMKTYMDYQLGLIQVTLHLSIRLVLDLQMKKSG